MASTWSHCHECLCGFLSSNTQDFIEVGMANTCCPATIRFLSSNTQDFIEVETSRTGRQGKVRIPEL